MYNKLQNLILGFLDAALWTEHDESTPQGGEPFDSNYGFEDLAPDTIHDACIDCAEFLAMCEAQGVADFEELIRRHNGDPDESAGHDFLLTRNGHGAGFWDGDWDKVDGAADKLTANAENFGCFGLYLGDDGLIYNHG